MFIKSSLTLGMPTVEDDGGICVVMFWFFVWFAGEPKGGRISGGTVNVGIKVVCSVAEGITLFMTIEELTTLLAYGSADVRTGFT